jgi:hypoxanthine phosphoribosyltransferase
MHTPLPILLTTNQIQTRLSELAEQLRHEYHGRPLTIVGVLTGSLMFLADLVRRLDLPLRIGLIQATSYRGAATTPGRLHINPELQPDLRGRHVLLLDDILDTGQTLSHLVRHLRGLGAASVKIAVLLRKQGRQVHEVAVDYIGFDIPDEFVVGYGLDYNDEYRQLPYIAVLPREVYAPTEVTTDTVARSASEGAR